MYFCWPVKMLKRKMSHVYLWSGALHGAIKIPKKYLECDLWLSILSITTWALLIKFQREKTPTQCKRFIYDRTKIISHPLKEIRSIERTGNDNLDINLVTKVKFCVTYIFHLKHAKSTSLNFLSVAKYLNIIICELSSKAIK